MRSSCVISAAVEGTANKPLPLCSLDHTNVKTVSTGAQDGSPHTTSLISIIKFSCKWIGIIERDQLRRLSIAFFLAPFSALSLAALPGLNILIKKKSSQNQHKNIGELIEAILDEQ